MALLSYIPITKVDAEQREIWGTGAYEGKDTVGEIMDYESSVPHFKTWSAAIEKRSGGKSKGNVREMHALSAVGKIIEMAFNDAVKTIDVGVKVVDDAAWAKVQEGVYTGFSIGGRYVRRWQDGDLIRYEAAPNELSLVDAPAMPDAVIRIVKLDADPQPTAADIAAFSDALQKFMDAQSVQIQKQSDERTEDSAEDAPDLRKAIADELEKIDLVDSDALAKLSASIDNQIKALASDIAAVVAELGAVRKMAESGGPVLREMGMAASQIDTAKLDALRELAKNATTPLERQKYELEIVRLGALSAQPLSI